MAWMQAQMWQVFAAGWCNFLHKLSSWGVKCGWVRFGTCSWVRHCSVRISNRGAALLSLLLNISLTMDRRFQMPSGSLPRRGLSKQAHSAAAGGSVDDRYMEFTSLRTTSNKKNRIYLLLGEKYSSSTQIKKKVPPKSAQDCLVEKHRFRKQLTTGNCATL